MGRIVSFIILLVSSCPVLASELVTLDRALDILLEQHKQLDLASLRVKREQLQLARVKGQVGWLLKSNAGVSHDLGFTGFPVDRAELGVEAVKPLESGGQLSIGATRSVEDNSQALFSNYPNPAHSTNVDIRIRKPLSQGAGNPLYNEARVSAEQAGIIARAEYDKLRDQLASDLINVFYGGLFINTQLDTAQLTIKRARRLRRFILKNARLGVSERKDILQAEAQLKARQAEYQKLQASWQRQRGLLLQLLSLPLETKLELRSAAGNDAFEPTEDLYSKALSYHHNLRIAKARAEIAEASLKRARNENRNKWDLVMSVGSRTLTGEDSTGANVNQSDYAGGLQIQFQRAMNRTSETAKLTQVQLDRTYALREVKRLESDLRYRLSTLQSEISASQLTLELLEGRLESERKKNKDAVRRYRTGRIDTARLIQFENELNLAELERNRERFQLVRKQAQQRLLTGQIWHNKVKHLTVGLKEGQS